MPLAKTRSYFVKGERQQNVNSSLMPSSSNQFEQIGANAAIFSNSSSSAIPKYFHAIFRIKRQQRKVQIDDGEWVAGASDETLKISENSNVYTFSRRHRRQPLSASIFTIPCFLLCLLSFLFIILLFLVTGYHLAKYMHIANDSMPIGEFRDDNKLSAIAGLHFGREWELYSANLFIEKENKKTENETLSGISFANGTAEIDILNGKSPLHFAVEKGNLELVKYLIENGTNVRTKNQNGWSPLHFGTLNGQRPILLYLLKYWQENGDENELESILKEMEGKKVPGNEWEKIKADLKQAMAKLNSKRNERLELPFGHAELKMQEYIHLQQMKRLGKKQRQVWGDLLKAAKHGKAKLVRKLLDQGADINATRNGFGNSALHLASTYGHLEVAKLLLERGADVRARNTKQQTALYYAACEGKEQVVILLIEFGAKVNARGKDGNTPMHCAAEEGWERIEQILIENGAEVNAKNERGYIPLHWAAQYGKVDACSTLLANGADVNAKVSKNEVTVIHLAAQEGHKHILELLLENGANLEEGDRYGWTALHYAIRNGRIGCVKFLLDKWNGHKNDGPPFFALIHGEDNQIKELMMRKLFHLRR